MTAAEADADAARRQRARNKQKKSDGQAPPRTVKRRRAKTASPAPRRADDRAPGNALLLSDLTRAIPAAFDQPLRTESKLENISKAWPASSSVKETSPARIA